MSKKKLLVSFLALTLVLSACAAPADIAPEAEPTPVESTAFTLVDALGREVVFEQPPSHIVLVGKALFMIADALYLFPDASKRIAAMGETAQGSGNFISLIDTDYSEKALLEIDAGA